MGFKYMESSGMVYNGKGKLISVVVSYEGKPVDDSHVALYNATSAATGEIMHLHPGSSGQTMSWTCETGILFDKLFATVTSAHCTIIWD